jgi:hypothetical protein
MIRKLKTFGLALGAVLALGALSATTAPAASFHSEAAHTTLSGSQMVATDDVWTINAGTIRCGYTSYSGTTTAATTETITVTPAYSECTAFGFVNAPIDVNGCTYTFNAGNDDLIIACPVGKTITVTAFNCHVSVGSQSIASSITYDNAGSGNFREVWPTLNLSGLKYTQVSKSFPGCTNGAFTNGTFKGSLDVRGTGTSGFVGVWHS